MLKVIESSSDFGSETLDTRVKPHVRIINGSLDDDPASPGSIVLQGRIDTSTLRFLKVDNEYQRPLGERADIFTAYRDNKVVPNIELGVRGQDFDTDGDDYLVYSPCYIIDGWQRVGTALRILETTPSHPLRIFASIHFGTDEIWERHRFTELNKNVKKVSPNLHLRNMRDTSPAVLTLFGLSNSERGCGLYKRVSWSQNMQRGHLFSALTLAKTGVTLHGHKASQTANTVAAAAANLDRIATAVGLNTFRRNITTYFSLIDECWPFASIEYRHAAIQIKSSFLFELARMLSRHPVFWERNDTVLTIGANDRRKLASFPIQDPQVVNLAGTGGKARNILYQLLLDHMNSGRRTQRLVSRFDKPSK